MNCGSFLPFSAYLTTNFPKKLALSFTWYASSSRSDQQQPDQKTTWSSPFPCNNPPGDPMRFIANYCPAFQFTSSHALTTLQGFFHLPNPEHTSPCGSRIRLASLSPMHSLRRRTLPADVTLAPSSLLHRLLTTASSSSRTLLTIQNPSPC